MKGLTSTKRELEAGVADAEAELARTEEYCRKLEELIAVGRRPCTPRASCHCRRCRRAPEFGGVTVVPDAEAREERQQVAPYRRASRTPAWN